MFRGYRYFLLMAAVVAANLSMTAGVHGQSSEAAKSSIAGGLAFTAELESSVDSKKLKVGDSVVARSTEALKIQGKTILPSGAKLMGHVMEAQARSKGDKDSLVAIQFDKAVLKNKEELPIGLVIRAMASQVTRSNDERGPGLDSILEGRNGTTSSPMNSNRTMTPPSAPNAGNGSETEKGSGATSLDAGGKLTPTSRGVYGIKGARLAVDTGKTPPASVVISTEKSVRLDSGTQLLFLTEATEAAATNP